MVSEHTQVILLKDHPELDLAKGDVGVVVHVHGRGAFEVEFMTLNGETIAVATLPAEVVREADRRDVAHSRERISA